MKTIGTAFVFMCALMLFGMPALGQITITSADVSTQLAVGDSLAYKFDKHTSSIDIGQHGQTSWNFISLRSDSSQTLRSIPISGAPFAGQFPGATHVFKTDIAIVYPALSSTPIPVTAYIYFQVATTDLLNPGEGANGTGTWTGASALITNQPADRFYKLPLTSGTAWTSIYLDTMVVSVPPFSFPGPGVRHNASYVVDAYGPMTLPGGSVHDALRIKKTDTTAARNTLGYIFLARDGASVQVTASDPSGSDVGTILIDSTATQWNGQLYALSIQLISFNAVPNTSGTGVLLRWSTLSEVNNYGFEIQRGVQIGGEFVTVSGAFIPGHGTTTVPRDYSYADVGAPSGTWYYRLKQIDLDGAIHYSDPAKVGVQAGGTGQDVPGVFSLGQNFPNPFNPETTIRYSLPSRSHVVLAVYNALGERVAVLAEGEQESGFHEVRFDGSALASGVYFYRLQSTGFVQTKKLSLLK